MYEDHKFAISKMMAGYGMELGKELGNLCGETVGFVLLALPQGRPGMTMFSTNLPVEQLAMLFREVANELEGDGIQLAPSFRH
jgi:hypothetical protein